MWQGYVDAYGLLAATEAALSIGYGHLVQIPASCDVVGVKNLAVEGRRANG